jgi:hypothetical protein
VLYGRLRTRLRAFLQATSVIRPSIEYACAVWQSGLTNEQRDRPESLQRRSLQLISNSHDYARPIYDFEPIATRLDNLARLFFHKYVVVVTM